MSAKDCVLLRLGESYFNYRFIEHRGKTMRLMDRLQVCRKVRPCVALAYRPTRTTLDYEMIGPMKIQKAPYAGKQVVWELKPPTDADFQLAQQLITKRKQPRRANCYGEFRLQEKAEEAAFVLWAVYGLHNYLGPFMKLPRFRGKVYGK